MSLIHFDGFERMSTAQAARRGWTFVNGAGSVTVEAGGTVGNRLRVLGAPFGGFSSEAHAYRGFVGVQRLLAGVSFQRDASSNSDSVALRLNEGGTTHLYVICGETGILTLYRGDGTPLATSPTFTIVEGDWQFLEIDATIDNVAGSVLLVVDGTTIFDLAGIDTRNGGAAGLIDRFYLACSSGGGFPSQSLHYFDDLYLFDSFGAELNELIGPARVDTQLVTANSGVPGFTPSAGANWENLDEAAPDDDTSYNETLTNDAADAFVLANLPDASLTIHAVAVRVVAKRSDAGLANIAAQLTSGGTTVTGTTRALGAGYSEYTEQFARNPDGDVEWDDAAISALVPGYVRPA
ncbi:MAG: hypothetical protein V4617_15080 [Gemmatimonadota bacterium]